MPIQTRQKLLNNIIQKIVVGSLVYGLLGLGVAFAEDCKKQAKLLRGDYDVVQADGGLWRFMEKSSRLRDDSMLGLQIDGILQRGVTHIENACKEGKPASPQLIKELEALISEARTLNNKSTSRTPAKKLKEMIQALLKSSREWAEKNSI